MLSLRKSLKTGWEKSELSLKHFFQSRKSILILGAAGVVVTMLIINLQPSMTHSQTQRPSTPVNYIEVKQQMLKPEIIGFGVVQPDLKLQAKAEITGRISYINPLLKKGEIFSKNTLLLKIDDKDYLLQLKQSQADVLANKANLKEMLIAIENNELELELASEKLKVRQKEFSRLSKLRETGAVSQSNLDAEKQNLLQQKQEVQQLKNKQSTLPSTLEVMKAQLEISKAKLQKSERDIERTEIRIPFNGRIGQVYTVLDQYMPVGSALFDATGLNKIKINAQFPISQFSQFSKNFDRTKIDFRELSEIPSMSNILESLGLTATVEEAGGDFKNWTAKVERFSDNLDPKTRTVGVIVTVEDSYKNLEPGSRPPLLEGMYVKVILKGAAINAIALPRFALHEDQVYTISKNNTLKRVTLSSVKSQGNLVLISVSSEQPALIEHGDRVITSDVFPAVSGMQLSPILDKSASEKMNQWLGDSQ